MRKLAGVLFAAAVFAGRYPSPVHVAYYVGPAESVIVGRVKKVAADGSFVITVLQRVSGKPIGEDVTLRVRGELPHATGAVKPELEPGRRFVLFVENGSAVRDWGGMQEVSADDTLMRRGVYGFGVEEKEPVSLRRFLERVKELSSARFRAAMLRDLEKGARHERERAIRQLTLLRVHSAAPNIAAIAVADGNKEDEGMCRTATAWLGYLDHPVVVPTLLRALESGPSHALAMSALEKLEGRSRRDAIPRLIERVRVDGTVQPSFANVLKELTGKNFGTDQKAWRDWWRKAGKQHD